MFRWFKKMLPDGEDECQELSSRARPPITAEEAFHKWIMTAPVKHPAKSKKSAKSKQPAKSKKQDNV